MVLLTHLASLELDRDNVTQGLVQEFDRDSEVRHGVGG